ncbi:hypothetical protein [Latilactobacillus sakei]|uniref:hypothetical protein n=1 Tax=Latilactobacillus sakei TaxID=1599 RepID=UPI00019CF8AB|nr:hypothetical protein [Latilactobacillus sakei]GEP21138.1 hypothetical protein LSA03nite_07260 [Latilactobacillus sakei subsp. carnosus]
MNKHMYLAVMFSIVLGLYIPKDMQFIATVIIMSSVITFIGVKHKEFFEGGDDNERTDSDISK